MAAPRARVRHLASVTAPNKKAPIWVPTSRRQKTTSGKAWVVDQGRWDDYINKISRLGRYGLIWECGGIPGNGMPNAEAPDYHVRDINNLGIYYKKRVPIRVPRIIPDIPYYEQRSDRGCLGCPAEMASKFGRPSMRCQSRKLVLSTPSAGSRRARLARRTRRSCAADIFELALSSPAEMGWRSRKNAATFPIAPNTARMTDFQVELPQQPKSASFFTVQGQESATAT